MTLFSSTWKNASHGRGSASKIDRKLSLKRLPWTLEGDGGGHLETTISSLGKPGESPAKEPEETLCQFRKRLPAWWCRRVLRAATPA
jgi:hypothetical protein